MGPRMDLLQRLVLASLILLSCIECIQGGTYKIAGVFSAETGQVESKVFARAVDRVNTDNQEFPEVQMQAIPIMLKEGETWRNYLELCRQFESGVVAIVGAESSVEDSLISSVSSAVRIPHIRTGFNRELEDPDDLSLALAPSPSDLAEVVRQLILHMGWIQIVYIYDTSTGLLRMNELEEDPEFKGRRLMPIDLSVDSNPWDNIVKLSIRHVVVDIESKSVHQVLKEISVSGLSQEYYSFIMPNSDIRIPENSTQQTFFLDADVYTFSLVDPENREMHWIYRMLEMNSTENEPNLPFIYDSVLQIGHTLNNLSVINSPIQASQGSCSNKKVFENGKKLYDSIRESTKFQGVTGFIEFDDKGARKVKHVHVKLLKDGILTKVADWVPQDGLTFIKELDPKGEPDEALEQDEGLNNRVLVVTTIQIPPFLMRDDSPQLKGNERYSGFIVDLLEKLSRLLKFQYYIKEVEDNQYGVYNESTKSYSGLIGEILLGKADIAVAPFTINRERFASLDFSFPFLEAGIGLLASREVEPLSHTFLSPFTFWMWSALFCTMCFATFVITFIARLSPREWSSVSETVIETNFTVGNCVWYLYSTIMFQRFQLKPSSPAVLVAFFAWFIFCLAVMVSYGTVLGDFIIKYNEKPILSKIDDLRSESNRVKFSAIRSGATMKFFEETEYPNYKQIYAKLDKEAAVRNLTGAIKRIKSEDFALFLETPYIEYYVGQDCSLQQVEGTVGSVSYGIAMSRGSTLTKYLSAGVLSLRREGALQALRAKWWNEHHAGKHCPNHHLIVRPTPFTVRFGRVNMLFVFLLGGLILSVAITIYNYVRKQMSDEDKGGLRYFIPTLLKEIRSLLPQKASEPANPSPDPVVA